MTRNKRVICGVDTGGTFTDTVLVDESGDHTTAKALSTPEKGFEKGFFNSVNAAAEKMGYEEDEIFGDIVHLAHGTTVATNTVVEDTGAKTGLLTTKGHEDAVVMMRGLGRSTGEPPERRTNIFIDKPDPIVPRNLIKGIPERIDSEGNIVAPLDEEAAENAIIDLVDAGIGAIAISFLWGIRHPEHEQRVKDLVEDIAPELYVSTSNVVAPFLGEYERTVATCINTIVGPDTGSYLDTLIEELDSVGFDSSLYIMQANGGTATHSRATDTPVTSIGSGPVGGLRGCERLSTELNEPNVIVADMGGTSFELGVIAEGEPLVDDEPVIEKYQYNIPTLDISSIGAGGGSIAKVDKNGNLRVGPESAGAHPGPMCYGRGGSQPTVTDADLLLGLIDPGAEFGEATDKEALARSGVEGLADQIGLSPLETAKGIFNIINTKMADLAEQKIIGRGYDPRDFILTSYGGAGPLHATSYAEEIGIQKLIVPGKIAPVWSAYGISQADIRYQLEQHVDQVEPFDPNKLEDHFAELEGRGRQLLAEVGISEKEATLHRIAKMQYRGQVHQLEVSVPNETLTQDTMETLIDRFEEAYKQRYSPSAHLPEAQAEIVALRMEPEGKVEKFSRAASDQSKTPTSQAKKSTRNVLLDRDQGQIEVDVYDGTELHPGNNLQGPAIIDMSKTSVVIKEQQRASVNKYYDFEIEVGQ